MIATIPNFHILIQMVGIGVFKISYILFYPSVTVAFNFQVRVYLFESVKFRQRLERIFVDRT